MASADSDFNVCVRCRPISLRELDCGCTKAVEVSLASNTVSIQAAGDSDEKPQPKSFPFDAVYGPACTQTDVYRSARPIMDAVLEGYDGAIFAYGQTGSGKGFTMYGVTDYAELSGVIPRCCGHIFDHISKATPDTRFLVRMSAFSIYQEDLTDLLSEDRFGKNRRDIKEHADTGVYVKDLTSVVVTSVEDTERIVKQALTNNSPVGYSGLSSWLFASESPTTNYQPVGSWGFRFLLISM